MRTMRWMPIAYACCLLGAACSGEPRPAAEPAPAEPAPAPAPTTDPPPTAAAPPVADVEPTPEELPVREDFEEEAALAITLSNYRAELDRLEQEIDADR